MSVSGFQLPCSYRLSGLAVHADRHLPGVLPQPWVAQPEVRITHRRLAARLDHATPVGTTCQWDGRRALWQIEGLGRFMAADGDSLDLEAGSADDATDLLPLALDTGIAALLCERGLLPLRAAAVAVDGRAVIIGAPGGVGTSTLVGALEAIGCPVLADTLIAIGADAAGRPVVWPDGRHLQMTRRSLEWLKLDDRCEGAVRAGIDRFYVRPAMASPGVMPLAGIYLLRNPERKSDETIFESLSHPEAAQALLTCGHRRLALAIVPAPVLRHLSGLVLREVPVIAVIRPRGLQHLDATAIALLTHVRSSLAAAAPRP